MSTLGLGNPADLLTIPADGITIVSVPAGHPYPRAIREFAPSNFTVLPDPDPDRPDHPAAGPWWPHRALEPSWLAGRNVHLMHLHFGFDHRSPAELAELVAFLRQRRCPLVFTVHDLRSPHQVDPTILAAQLDVLVPAADSLITLTPWAADQIRMRWGREATVVRHPPLVPEATSRRLRDGRPRGSAQPVIGLAVKSLRPNCDPVRLLPALEAAAEASRARLRVTVHTEMVARPRDDRARGAARALAEASDRGVEIVAHDPLSDERLWADLAVQDVVVLPHRFGTHSGWLEASHDVGSHVAAPDFGGYADQGADGVFVSDEDSLDDESVVACVRELVDRARAGRLAGDDADVQAERRRSVAAAHDRIYRTAIRRSAACR